MSNYYKKYQKYKKKYLNAKEMKGGLIAKKQFVMGLTYTIQMNV